MIERRFPAAVAATLFAAGWISGVDAAPVGIAELRVETTPPASAGVLRFEGVPEGAISVSPDGVGRLSAEALDGRHVSTLVWIDPALIDAGYRLVEVVCDDVASERRSHGDSTEGMATFNIDGGETVACVFRLAVASACACPEEGRWRVQNHRGSMVCTGAMAMTMPLKPSRQRGTMTVNDDCTRILAEGMSDDEADLTMVLQPDCSWRGAVGGQQDGIPMTINFQWSLENERRITGDLDSTVSQQGMTCRMSRTFELDHAN